MPVEVFVPDCESAYLSQTRGPLAGRRIRLREARADFDGYIAELLSKALSQAQLDQPLTAEDRDRLLAYLRRLGALDQQRQYRGSSRRGPDDQGRPRHRWRCAICSAAFPTSTCRPIGPPSRR